MSRNTPIPVEEPRLSTSHPNCPRCGGETFAVRFLSIMHHEVRTPLAGVFGMTELLLDTRLTSEQREYARMVLTSAERLLAVFEEFMCHWQLEAGRMPAEARDFDLDAEIEDTVAPHALAAQAKGLRFELPRALSAGRVRADLWALRQVVSHLLDNAVKFTDRGEVVVRTEVGPGARGAMALTLSVRDTGIGIPADQHRAIFEPYALGEAHVRFRRGGLGLGLTIARAAAARLGGGIELTSAPGAGSTFTATLRLAPAASGTTAPSSAGETEGGPRS